MGPDCLALPCVRRCSWWVPAVRGKLFFTKYSGPSAGSLLSGGGIIILHVLRRTSLLRPWTQLSASPRTVHVRWKSFLDHVDHAAPRAPRRWTTARPRKGTTRSRGRRGSGCPRVEEYEGLLVHCGVRLPSPQSIGMGMGTHYPRTLWVKTLLG